MCRSYVETCRLISKPLLSERKRNGNGVRWIYGLVINHRKHAFLSVSNHAACLRGYVSWCTDLGQISSAKIYETGRTCVRQQGVNRLLRLQQDPGLVYPVPGDASWRTLEQIHVPQSHFEITAIQPIPETNRIIQIIKRQ